MFIPMTYISSLFIVLHAILGTESYSVWCWSGSFLLIWALLYLHIGQWLVTKYEVIDVHQTDNILIKFFFKGMHEHLQRFEGFKYK